MIRPDKRLPPPCFSKDGFKETSDKVLTEIRAYFGKLLELGDVVENAQELVANLVAFLLMSGPNLKAELDYLLSKLDQLWSLVMLLDKPQHFDENQTRE